MSVESATYIADLQALNPPATDPRSQGDDHLRLIKQVLQNSFSGSSRQWQVPGVKTVSTTTYTILKTDGEGLLSVSTASGAVTLTLPNTLTSADAGWRINIIKSTSDTNPVFIAPISGNLNSGGAVVAKARRCIPFVQIVAVWDGAAWFVTRALALPIGSCIEYHGSSLPAGYEWPSGQTLSSAANYPEYNAVMGGLGTMDKRGYTSIAKDNLGGSAAGRLPGGIISGSILGATGGVDTRTLTLANLPAFTPAGTITNGAITVTISDSGGANIVGGSGAYCPGGGSYGNPSTPATLGITASASQASSTFAGTSTSSTMLSTPFGNLQPSIMVNQILVVE